LQASLTGGNRNDVTQLIPLIQDIPPVRGRRGRPRRRPDTVYADRAYDHDKYRKQVRAVGVTPVIARRGTEHGSGLGQHRWVVEQTFALLHWFRRLRIRWEIRDDIRLFAMESVFGDAHAPIVVELAQKPDLQGVPGGRARDADRGAAAVPRRLGAAGTGDRGHQQGRGLQRVLRLDPGSATRA